MQPTTVWLVRHAETENPHVFNGAETDIGLSDLGFRQAEMAAEWFTSLKPTIVISSAMRRAVDTAQPIVERCRVRHQVEPELHERRIGSLAGTSFSLAEGPWVETLRRWQLGEISYTTPGAESFEEIRDRVFKAWRRNLDDLQGERVVVVAHGVVCKVLLLSLLADHGPADWARIGKAANLSVSELVRTTSGWEARFLLQVPESVARITSDFARLAPVAAAPSVA